MSRNYCAVSTSQVGYVPRVGESSTVQELEIERNDEGVRVRNDEEVQTIQTVSATSLVSGHGTDMVVSGRSCATDAEGTPVPSPVCDLELKLSIGTDSEDEAIESGGGNPVILRPDL